jgi:competence protein ComEA
MRLKKIAEDYFNFTRKDRIAVVTIIGLIVCIYLLTTILYSGSKNIPPPTDTGWIAAMKKIEESGTENNLSANQTNYDDNSNNLQYDKRVNNFKRTIKGELFFFDPNTLSIEGWQKLGLRDKTISTIQNYISKGGRFKKPEDLQKIYGLFPDEFQRIAPFVKIENQQPDTKAISSNADKIPAKTYTPRYTVIDINMADTTAFILLPGIGSKLAARIVNFREKLGGFYSISQVGETFGLPDSTFQKIRQYLKLENVSVKKININTAAADELKAHPYIRWNIANPLIAYRKEHGPFTRVEDLKKIMVITEDIYNKISPYLSVQ